jgi:lysozyme
MRDTYLNEIKSFEGFAAQAKWDYAQFTNGYGTRALFAGEKIDEAEASRRFAAELDEARKFVDKHTEGWDEGTKAALTSLTFNAGTRWASSGLGDAVRAFDVDAVRERFLAYTKAGRAELPGLVKRRLEEVTWIGNPGAADATRVASAAPSTQVMPAVESNSAGPEAPIAQEPIASAASATIPDLARHPDTSDPDPQAVASLSLLLLALDLTAPPSLAAGRRNDERGSGSERA